MKKIFSIALAATLLAAGCQKTEVVGLDESKTGPAMTFSTEMKKITKADEEPTEAPSKNLGTQTLENQNFLLWAFADYNFDGATNVNEETLIYDGMEGMKIAYNKTKQTWNPDPLKEYYWPGNGEKYLRFFAVSGIEKSALSLANINHGITSSAVAQDVEGGNTEGGNTEGGEPSTPQTPAVTAPSMTIPDFTVGTNADVDLMVADYRKQKQTQDSRTVRLNFHHALSKVQFDVKASKPEGSTVDFTAYIQKLTVTDISSKGTLTVTYTPATAGTDNTAETATANITMASWDLSPATTDIISYSKESTVEQQFSEIEKIKENGEEIYDENLGTKLTVDADATTFATWLMLPQTLANKTLEVIYIINGRQFKAEFPLSGNTTANPSTAVTNWDVNQYTKYTINLSPNLISFDAKVETDWASSNDIDYVN